MKVLFDHQIFELQKFGGVSRIYFELLRHFNKDNDMQWELPIRYTDNAYLKTIPFFDNKLAPIPRRPDYLQEFLWGANFKGKRIIYELKKKVIAEPSGIDVSAVNKSLVIEKLRAGNFDVFHPTYYDDYFLEHLNEKPFVLTVYDLIHQIFPEYFMYNDLDKNKKLLQKASRILTISESTKTDLVSIFGIDERKVTVTLLANSLEGEANGESPAFTKELPEKYFLFIGNRTEYKNFLFFIRLFATVSGEYPQLNVVCTGPDFSKDERYYFKKLGVEQKLKHFFVSDQDLAWIYKYATALMFPSQYEGFGLPVMEAFSCGCPVLLADNSSLKEIAGDAAYYFESKNPVSMLSAMRALLNDPGERLEKISRGYAQLKKFSWQQTADRTIEAYKQVLNNPLSIHS